MKKLFFKFILGGGFVYCLRYLLLYVLIDSFKLSFYLVYPLILIAVIIIGFNINFFLVFESKEKKTNKLIKFTTISVCLNSIDYLICSYLLSNFKISHYVIVFCVSSILIILKFILFKVIVFRD
jgi:putative flippase GtrA